MVKACFRISRFKDLFLGLFEIEENEVRGEGKVSDIY